MQNPPPSRSPSGAPGAVRQASPLARAGSFAYVTLILYGSLTPFSGWRDNGVGPFAFLGAPWPAHVTTFDLCVNVLAYIPLGALLVLAQHPHVRRGAAVVLAAVGGVLLSTMVEALQTYLPSRVASNVDLLTNGLGALVGAVAAAMIGPDTVIDRGRIARMRIRWFDRRATGLLILMALWPAAQIHPGAMLFGNGGVHAAAWLGLPFAAPAQALFGPVQFVVAETLVTLAAALASGCALAAAMRARAPRAELLTILLLASLATKVLAYGINFGPEHAFDWLTPGALFGLALGVLATGVVLITVPVAALRRLAIVALAILLLLVNLVPDNPYHAVWLGAWHPGRLLHFSAVAAWLATAWPYALLAWLLLRPGAQRRSIGPRAR